MIMKKKYLKSLRSVANFTHCITNNFKLNSQNCHFDEYRHVLINTQLFC